MKLHWHCDPYRIHTHTDTVTGLHALTLSISPYGSFYVPARKQALHNLGTHGEMHTHATDIALSVKRTHAQVRQVKKAISERAFWWNMAQGFIMLVDWSSSFKTDQVKWACRCASPSPSDTSKLHHSSGESRGCRINTCTNLTPALRPSVLHSAALPLCGHK